MFSWAVHRQNLNFLILLRQKRMSKTTKRRTRTHQKLCIIAHIDHGKSTLADRLLEITGAVADREKQAQILDSMELERSVALPSKRKRQLSTIKQKWKNLYFKFNRHSQIMSTLPYEVSRSLTACEGSFTCCRCHSRG